MVLIHLFCPGYAAALAIDNSLFESTVRTYNPLWFAQLYRKAQC